MSESQQTAAVGEHCANRQADRQDTSGQNFRAMSKRRDPANKSFTTNDHQGDARYHRSHRLDQTYSVLRQISAGLGRGDDDGRTIQTQPLQDTTLAP